MLCTYKPNNKKAKANVLYRGAIEWNAMGAELRNLDCEQFKKFQKQKLVDCHKGVFFYDNILTVFYYCLFLYFYIRTYPQNIVLYVWFYLYTHSSMEMS